MALQKLLVAVHHVRSEAEQEMQDLDDRFAEGDEVCRFALQEQDWVMAIRSSYNRGRFQTVLEKDATNGGRSAPVE